MEDEKRQHKKPPKNKINAKQLGEFIKSKNVFYRENVVFPQIPISSSSQRSNKQIIASNNPFESLSLSLSSSRAIRLKPSPRAKMEKWVKKSGISAKLFNELSDILEENYFLVNQDKDLEIMQIKKQIRNEFLDLTINFYNSAKQIGK